MFKRLNIDDVYKDNRKSILDFCKFKITVNTWIINPM